MKTDFPSSQGSSTVIDEPQAELARLSGHTPSAEKAVPTVLMVHPEYRDLVFSPELVSEIDEIAGKPTCWLNPRTLPSGIEALECAEVLFCSWETPIMDAAFLDAAPNLKAVFYAAGCTKGFATPELARRGVVLSSAQAANAIPVVEFSTAAILLSLKRVWLCMRETHRDRSWNKPERTVAGAYASTVGLVSLGMIGRGVAKALTRYDLQVLAYDPFVPDEKIRELGAEPASLERIFEESDVVSVHTPLWPETMGMLGGDLFERMKARATLVNTSRGAVLRQSELIEVLKRRPDLTAMLDVTDPEPPEADSPLWDLPNVFLTPHTSGSLGPECRRMARYMVDEFRRFTRGAPLLHEVRRSGSSA